MKKLLTLLLSIAIAVAVIAYFNPKVLNWLRHTSGTDQSSTVYKWQDKNGVWHVTDEPPPPGTPYQKQEYLNNTNVLPAPKQNQR